MTPAETFVHRTTSASGVPLRVEDPATLARLAALLAPKPALVIETTEGGQEGRRRVRRSRHAA